MAEIEEVMEASAITDAQHEAGKEKEEEGWMAKGVGRKSGGRPE